MNPPNAVFDLNCDLGEGEPPERTRALLRLVTSANICCGVHAGSEELTRQTAALALEHRVNPGAHPGLPGAFGRGKADISPAEFAALILSQAGFFARVCRELGAAPSHLKLHGALYHLAEDSPPHREAFAGLARRLRDGLGIGRFFTRAGGPLADLLLLRGVEVFPEAFLDRAYLADGTLAPRGAPGAVITSKEEALARFRLLAARGRITAVDGTQLRVAAKTLCVHGDNPAALEILEAVAAEAGRKALSAER